MDITLQYSDGCPNWEQTDADLKALEAEGIELRVSYQRIETPEAAAAAGFRGSPTVLVDGTDPFANSDALVGLSCRVYSTEKGFAGTPTLDQLRDAVAAAS